MMLKDGDVNPSKTFKVKSPCGEMFVTLVFDVEKLRPVTYLIHMGKAGGCARLLLSTLADKLSHICIHEDGHMRKETIIQMTGTHCHAGATSCIDELALTLLRAELQLSEGTFWERRNVLLEDDEDD